MDLCIVGKAAVLHEAPPEEADVPGALQMSDMHAALHTVMPEVGDEEEELGGLVRARSASHSSSSSSSAAAAAARRCGSAGSHSSTSSTVSSEGFDGLPEELMQLRSRFELHLALNAELRDLSERAEQYNGVRRHTLEGDREYQALVERAAQLVAEIEHVSSELADASEELWELHEAVCEHQQNEVLIGAVETRHVELFATVRSDADITPQLREEEGKLLDEMEQLEALFAESYAKVQAALERYHQSVDAQ